MLSFIAVLTNNQLGLPWATSILASSVVAKELLARGALFETLVLGTEHRVHQWVR